jgi:hypothetical protein
MSCTAPLPARHRAKKQQPEELVGSGGAATKVCGLRNEATVRILTAVPLPAIKEQIPITSVKIALMRMVALCTTATVKEPVT